MRPIHEKCLPDDCVSGHSVTGIDIPAFFAVRLVEQSGVETAGTVVAEHQVFIGSQGIGHSPLKVGVASPPVLRVLFRPFIGSMEFLEQYLSPFFFSGVLGATHQSKLFDVAERVVSVVDIAVEHDV